VAVSLSTGGSEAGDLHLYETGTAQPTDVVIPRVNYGTGGGSLAWDANGHGFFYTRYPRPGERPPEDHPFYLQAYHHTLGHDPERDRYEIGREFPSAPADLPRRRAFPW
jgi:prolyl oligopeptidase